MSKIIGMWLLHALGATFSVALLVTSFAAAQHPEHPEHPTHPEHPAHPDHPGAGSQSVPEISAYGAPAGLALVIGGVAVVLGRRARRQQNS
jgi:hypothetical protein